jgi:isocitrate dehydrogenase kinase/phosphatase
MPSRSATDTKAVEIAASIHDGFDRYRRAFRAITLGARERFARADWHGIQQAARDRLDLYEAHATAVAADVRAHTGTYPAAGLWARVKQAFLPFLALRVDHELAETFFNSIHRKVMRGAYVLEHEMFVRPGRHAAAGRELVHVFKRYQAPDGVDSARIWRDLLADVGLGVPFEDAERDAVRVAGAVHDALAGHGIASGSGLHVDLVRTPFYRNKGTYLVGRVGGRGPAADPSGGAPELALPFALPIVHTGNGGVYVDAFLHGEEDLSVVFSFTRSYFMVDAVFPSALVAFLQALMPQKKPSELYTAIGFSKHGKTVFYRGFLDHLEHSDDQFVIADGIRGLVMAVFTLPSYQTVFKVIRDEFAHGKDTTPERVRAAYGIVKRHDRVGRMADTQEFTNMVFPRERFADDLVAELERSARRSVRVLRESIVVSHLYTERLMTPLNLYLERCTPAAARAAIDDFGNAIRQLAAANIFPGDMLTKNFGVTRHGRVVFYDYDEIAYLTDVSFHDLPPSRDDDEELAAEKSYDGPPDHIFPAQLLQFLFGRDDLKRAFLELHGDLLKASYWRRLQDAVRAGSVVDFFPYPRSRRFAPERGDAP